jgi:hypothetical protein
MNTYQDIAAECTKLMNQVEAAGYIGNSDDGDSRMVRIMEIANVLQVFAPELLDPRFA